MNYLKMKALTNSIFVFFSAFKFPAKISREVR